jgi:hypothetical protein
MHSVASAVTSVGFADAMPMEGLRLSNGGVICAEDGTYCAREIPPLLLLKYVFLDFFRAVITQVVAGRKLNWTEVWDLRAVALFSLNLAREPWCAPSAALGKRFRQIPIGQSPDKALAALAGLPHSPKVAIFPGRTATAGDPLYRMWDSRP